MNAFNHVEEVRTGITEFLAAADKLRNLNFDYVKAGMGAAVTDEVMIQAFGSKTVGVQEVPVVTAAEFVDSIGAAQAVLAAVDTNALALLKMKR